MGRFYHIAVKVFYKSSTELFHIFLPLLTWSFKQLIESKLWAYLWGKVTGYKVEFTPSKFLSVLKKTGNTCVLFHNEEMLVSKSSVSFVCIHLVDLSVSAVAITCFCIKAGLYTQNNCGTNTGSVLAGMAVMKIIPQWNYCSSVVGLSLGMGWWLIDY